MNPDELLAQIRALLDEYLAMGEETPVAAEAQALAAAIDSGGGAAPPGEEGLLGGLGGPPPGEEPLPGGGPLEPLPMEGGPPPKTFGEANKTALPRLQKANADAEEEDRKKKAKA